MGNDYEKTVEAMFEFLIILIGKSYVENETADELSNTLLILMSVLKNKHKRLFKRAVKGAYEELISVDDEEETDE